MRYSNKNPLRIATIFSGIGSFEFALKRMNIPYEIVFACDNGDIDLQGIDYIKELDKIRSLQNLEDKNSYVRKLYKGRSRKTNFVEQTYLTNYEILSSRFFYDVRLMDGRPYKGLVDIIVGGPPCQSFSSVGNQSGMEDARGTLFYEYARLIDEIRPKYFIFENVRGLYTHDNKNTWKVISRVFGQLGYRLTDWILNSKDYGIPQNRNRLIAIGIMNKDLVIEKPRPRNLYFHVQDILEDNCSFGNYQSKDTNITIIRSKNYFPSKYILSEKVEKYVRKSGTKKFVQRPQTDLKIARPILATMSYNHRAGIDNYYSCGDRLRMLTEREAARLMGFTDDFILHMSSPQAYRQLGNSIVVDVLIEVMKSLLEAAKNEK